MRYEAKKHITTRELADLLGVAPARIASYLATADAPRSLGKATVGAWVQSLYDRAHVMTWMDKRAKRVGLDAPQHPDAPKVYRGEIVPPRDLTHVGQQGEYRPSPELSINFARAAEVYPHRLITPKSIGNGTERVHGFGRGA